MTDAVRLDTMVASVRQRANQEAVDESTAFCTDNEITKLLNYFLRRVYSRLVRARGAGYYRAFTNLTITNGTSLYSLAAQVLEIISVSLVLSGTDKQPIYPYTEAERHAYDLAGGWDRGQPVAYQLQGNNMNFIPTPSGGYTVRVNYVPAFTDLAADGDTFDGVIGFEDAAIWETVAALKDKDEADPSYALMQAKFMYEEIEALKDSRDNTAPARVQRIRRARRNGRWF